MTLVRYVFRNRRRTIRIIASSLVFTFAVDVQTGIETINGWQGSEYISENSISFHKDVEWWPLREKCPYSEFFWSAFSRIRTEYGTEKLLIRTLFMQWVKCIFLNDLFPLICFFQPILIRFSLLVSNSLLVSS